MDKKEEIARKHGFIDGTSIHSFTDVIQQKLYDCMEEYANYVLDQRIGELESFHDLHVPLVPKEKKVYRLVLKDKEPTSLTCPLCEHEVTKIKDGFYYCDNENCISNK